MSWDSYVNDNLVGSGHCRKAAIFGLDGTQWAASAQFGVKAGEGAAIAAVFKDPPSAFAKGATLEGEKFMAIKSDGRSFYAKKGSSGFSAVKTNQCILLGFYDDKIQPGANANVVEKLADYLIENNY